MFVPASTADAVFDAVSQGRSVLVTGSWGSGKTALLRCIASRLGPHCCSKPLDDFAIAEMLTDERVAIVDDHDTLDDLVQVAVAARVRSKNPTLVSTSTGGRISSALHQALRDTDSFTIALGPLDLPASMELLGQLRGEVSVDQARASLERTGGIGLLIASSALPPQEFGRLQSPISDLHAVVGTLRLRFPTDVRNLFDALVVTAGLPLEVATKGFGLEALDGLEAFQLLHPQDEPHGSDEQIVRLRAEVLEDIGSEVLGRADRRTVLTQVLDFCELFDPRQPSLRHCVRRAHWAEAVEGYSGLLRTGLRAAMITADFSAVVSFARLLLTRDPTDFDAAHCLSIGYEAMGDHRGAASTEQLIAPTADAAWRMRHAVDTYLSNGSVAAVGFDTEFADDPLSEALAHQSWLHLFSGDVITADQTATAVLRRPQSSSQATVWAALAQSTARAIRGAGPSAGDVLDRAVTLVDDDGVNPFAGLQLGVSRLFVQIRSGQTDLAYRNALVGIAASPHPILGAGWHGFAGIAARERAMFDEAVAHFDESINATSGDPFGLRALAQSERDLALTMLGRPAQPVLGTSPPVGVFAALVLRNDAAIASARFRVDEACVLARAAADHAAERSQLIHEILALVDLARYGHSQEAMLRVRNISEFDNALVRVGAQIVTALADRRRETVLRAVLAARTISWGVAQDELALVGIDLTRRFGDLALAARLELAWAPTRWPTPLCRTAPPNMLTGRELELGRLAVSGRTTPEIAEALSISARTVDNVLGRLYAKCQVQGRSHLSELVGSDPTMYR